MKILAIDTSSSDGGVTILKEEKVLFHRPFQTKTKYGQTVFPLMEEGLDSLKLSLKDIDLFAVNAGPGSYTGLRVGVTCINGLAWSHQQKSLGVSSLFALAHNYQTEQETILVSVLYANKNENFSAVFKSSKGKIEQIEPDKKRSWEDLLQWANKEEIFLYAANNQEFPLTIPSSKVKTTSISSEMIGKSAWHLAQKKQFEKPGRILPNYLKDFEVTTKKKRK